MNIWIIIRKLQKLIYPVFQLERKKIQFLIFYINKPPHTQHLNAD